ncbi:MAG: bifunctional DNA-formamidopyrimidine glycosylase/DNA-(apurinic or apyrimidinic site) lyase, partial [Dehalococcoidales bacterium]|nr:bifunctional DNA-formamidopyrimidine glycosylase/DNA-(apurinic or apyrimidinic site) lyase [Dehalococcoidales bacterium]
EEFRTRISGRRILALSRRGKYLIFNLDGGGVLVMHMKMAGSLLVNPKDAKFSRAIFHLDDGTKLHFRDPRKFGVMWLAEDGGAVDRMLGPEPLDDDFTPELLERLLHRRKAPVKPVLMDQAVIAGIGNMYADEALFEAKIHPLRPASDLSRDEIGRLYDAIRLVLRRGLEEGGASIRNYIRPDGSPGTAHTHFVVAHGMGNRCPRCGTAIKRIVVRGRGTYFCPGCQKL